MAAANSVTIRFFFFYIIFQHGWTLNVLYSPHTVEELKVMVESQVWRNGISKRCRQSGVLRVPSGVWKWIAGRCRRNQSKCEWGNRKLKADLLTVEWRVDVVCHTVTAWAEKPDACKQIHTLKGSLGCRSGPFGAYALMSVSGSTSETLFAGLVSERLVSWSVSVRQRSDVLGHSGEEILLSDTDWCGFLPGLIPPVIRAVTTSEMWVFHRSGVMVPPGLCLPGWALDWHQCWRRVSRA